MLEGKKPLVHYLADVPRTPVYNILAPAKFFDCARFWCGFSGSHRETSLYFEDSVGYQSPSNSLNLPGKMSGRPATWPRASPRCSKVSPRAPDGARPGAGLKCSDDALASRGRGFQPFPMTDFAHVLATTQTSSTKRVLICHSCGLIARGPCAPFFVALHTVLGRLSC